MNILAQQSESVKHVVDLASVTAVTAAIMGYVPDATACLSLIWVIIRLLETDTIRGILRWLKLSR